jgi:hypothetical protein
MARHGEAAVIVIHGSSASWSLEKPSSLLIEHDGLIHFEERPLDRRLRQSVPLQYLIIRSAIVAKMLAQICG